MMNPQTARMLTYGLGGVCGFLLLIAVAQQFNVGRGYHWSAEDADAQNDMPSAQSIQRDVATLGPEPQYHEVRDRPLFNEDRKPTPPEEAQVAEDEKPAVPLNVTLTGVIITPQVKLAMLKDNAKGDAHSLREGMPLPGDQAVWTVVEIQARKIVLKGGNNETNELQLDVSAVTPPASTPTGSRLPPPPQPPAQPPPGAPPGAQPAVTAVDPNGAPPVSDRAAELQKRIEERRREMREQAERLRAQQQQPNQQKQESE